MEKKKSIPMIIVKRLIKYHGYLHDILNKGVSAVSSERIGRKLGFTPTQVRQDLCAFGCFGQPGYGYNVAELYSQISEILSTNKEKEVVIIGAGNIGQAIANYKSFLKLGLKIEGIFEANQNMVGLKVGDTQVYDVRHLQRFLMHNQVEIGVICVPAESAQSICDILVSEGVKGIWNFAPIDLITPEDVIVENVHLSSSLLTLTCLLNSNKEEEPLRKLG